MAENVKVLKAEKYVALAVAALERETILPQAFTRISFDAFKGAAGDTVTFRGEGITKARDYEWRTRTAPIVLDQIATSKTAITLGTHVYSGVAITDEQLTLDIENFVSEVLNPQLTAVRERLESKTIAAMANENWKIKNLNAKKSDDPYLFALGARRQLNQQGTPAAGRTLLVGANVEEWLLTSQSLRLYDTASATNAYREAVFGRIAGFDVVSSNLIGENDIYATHPSALVLANAAPVVPQGVTYGATRTFQGYGLRVIRDYDPNYIQDRSIVSSFSGIAGVHDDPKIDGTTKQLVITDGLVQYNDWNVRGAKGAFNPAA